MKVCIVGALGEPLLASSATRRVDDALFVVAALKNDKLILEAR